MRFEEVVHRLSPKLKGIARKLNGYFSFFNEEDLYQEALIHLWLDFKQRKLINKTDSYILQGCYFYLKNYIRKNYDKANLISLENMTEEDEISQLYSESINYKMLIERINNNGLTKREKEVFHLALEGLTAREIGARLGISHVRVVKLKGKIKDKYKSRKYVELF